MEANHPHALHASSPWKVPEPGRALNQSGHPQGEKSPAPTRIQTPDSLSHSLVTILPTLSELHTLTG